MPQTPPDHWNALIAGVFVIIGVLLAQGIQTLSAWRERKHRRAAVLLQKLEELTIADRAVLHWMETYNSCTTLADTLDTSPAEPIHRMSSLTLLYFPRLKPIVSAYHKELLEYYGWANHCIRNELQQSVAVQLLRSHESEYQDRYQKIADLRQRLAGAIELEVHIHLG